MTLKSGNVGIGTASPGATLHVSRTSLTAPSLTFDADATAIFRSENQQIAFGSQSTSPYPVYIQGRDIANAAVNLALNPLGGNVGIGTTVPEARTQITGGGLCVGSDANCNTDNNTEGTVYSSNTAMTVYDVAENYPTRDTEVGPADIVALDGEQGVFVKKATSAGGRVLGVISGNPAVLLGGFNGAQFKEERQVAVGLSGRIPVKVNLEGGPIAIGDHLSLSSVPGVAKKAADGEQSIGYALENWTETQEAAQRAGNVGTPLDTQGGLTGQAGTIQFFITHGTMAGLTVASLTDELAQQPAPDSLAGKFLTNLFARVTEWLASATNGIQEIVSRTFRAKDQLCINDTCVNEDQLKALLAGAAGSTGSPQAAGVSDATSGTSAQGDDNLGTGAVEILIHGNNPAELNVGDSYNDLGATASTTDSTIEALGVRTFFGGQEVQTVSLDTGAAGTYTVEYKVIDAAGSVLANARCGQSM